MLQVKALNYNHSAKSLFSELTFDVKCGTLLNITGCNGAGKSTLCRLLAGVLTPDKGNIYWHTTDLPADIPADGNLIWYISHKLGIHPEITPLENLKWLSALHQPHSDEFLMQVLRMLNLSAKANIPCRFLSRGQNQRVALARLWLQYKLCWILDEPFSALDAQGEEVLKQKIIEHLNQHGIVIISSHGDICIPYQNTIVINLGDAG